MPDITGLHTVGVPVTDQDAALAFYGALGFETCLDLPMGEGARWIEVAPPGAAVSSPWSPPTLIGLRAPRRASA